MPRHIKRSVRYGRTVRERRWQDAGDPDAVAEAIAGWPGKRSRSADQLGSSRVNRPAAGVEHFERGSPAALLERLGAGEALDSRIASAAAEAYGASFGHVRIHTGAAAAQLARAEGARAFAIGEHIAFASGQYNPGTPEGDALIAHELVHVVQQQHLGPAAIQHKKLAEDSTHEPAELEADEAAKGLLLRIYGGAKTAIKAITQMPSKMSLRRCPDSGPALPADPLVQSLYAKLTSTPADIAGFYGELAALNGARATDANLLAGFRYAISHGKLSYRQAFRAVAYLAYGPLTSWPLPVKNFADAVDAGTYTITALPPAGADPLREFCVRTAAQQADGTGVADVMVAYRNEFNAKFESTRFSALSSDFDPALDSKGPRSQRARSVFNEIYNDVANPRFKTAYDTRAPLAFREMCDTMLGPDGTNLTASPRLQELRATLAGPVVSAINAADPLYVALLGRVTPKAAALDARDRQELDRQHSWRLAVDAAVSSPTVAVAQELRDDLWRIITTSRSAAPIAPVAPAPPAAAAPAPVPNAAQTAFLAGIHLTAPPSPQNAQTADHPLTFRVVGPANPGLVVNRRVVIEPAAQVLEGQDDEQAWANGATAVDHTATVDPQPTAGPSSVFTARLTMPPLSTVTFPEKTATVTVFDKRLDWFKAHLAPGLTYVNFTDATAVASGGAAHYTGKQCPIDVRPNVGGGMNPGLDIQIDGSLKKGGVVMFPIARAAFARTAANMALFKTILQEPAVPPAVPENWELTLRMFQGTGAVVEHTITWPFTIAKSSPASIAADTVRMGNENTWLNEPIASAGHLLHHMVGMGGNHERVARAVAGGALKIRSCFVRSDSADQVTALAGNPVTQVAYGMGVIDPLATRVNTLVAQPGAAGWRWSAHPDTVYLNVTPVPGGGRRSVADLAEFLAHEGIHAADRASGLDATWDSYATEFRAYWIMGVGSTESTAFDPTMSGIGPKARRARAVFGQVYGSPTYPTFKPAYDGNVNRFRERADSYLFPDGINLALSPQLADLRVTIEAYVSGVTVYATTKTAVTTKYAACIAGDQAEIHNNRMWRDLVEAKFLVAAEQLEIKTLLGIPR